MSHLGVFGYVLFWGLTALAAGVFGYRLYQLYRYLSLGRKEESYGQLFRRAVTAIGHLIAQQCQFKNLTRKDRAGIGHMLMAWGFLLFIVYYFFFIIIAFGFGVSDVMEHNPVYVVYTWIMDIVAPFIMLGALWGIIRRYIIKPPRLEGHQTFAAVVILVTRFIHPLTHLGKNGTQIAPGDPPPGPGVSFPPASTAFRHIYTSRASLGPRPRGWFLGPP
ncbi:MAG: hypothetical protein H8D49_01460, partial [Dehalococcoidia bacterium]|nr:hypothetical protein [Dehalococcoidia bacterium]